MKLTHDKMGCVIDVPSKFEEFIAETWEDDDKVSLFKMTELPELQADERRGYGGGGGGYGGNRGYGGRQNGNSSGGYGGRQNGGYSNGGGNANGFKRKSNFGYGNNAKRTRQ